jgi:hypothetical protein
VWGDESWTVTRLDREYDLENDDGEVLKIVTEAGYSLRDPRKEIEKFIKEFSYDGRAIQPSASLTEE